MNRFIMADASKCIGCRTCEVACVVSHQAEQDCASLTPDTFLPRIHVIKGVNISTAAICRQCEDAPCANVCPNGAIKREKGFVHVMQERCIGCKTCVVACPYGAMEVVVRPVVPWITICSPGRTPGNWCAMPKRRRRFWPPKNMKCRSSLRPILRHLLEKKALKPMSYY